MWIQNSFDNNTETILTFFIVLIFSDGSEATVEKTAGISMPTKVVVATGVLFTIVFFTVTPLKKKEKWTFNLKMSFIK